MKKVLLTIGFISTLGLSQAIAAPYSATLNADVYDATPDAVTTPAAISPYNIYNAINTVLGTSYASNADLDPFQITTGDSLFTDVSTVSVPTRYSLISLSAANNNTLRVYDASNPGTLYDVFGGSVTGFGVTGDGTAANPFPTALSPFSNGTIFGFNLLSEGTAGSEWDSDPTKNIDGLDHMLTYRLSDLIGKSVYLDILNTGNVEEYTFQDPYLVTFEDMALNDGKIGDEDYDDGLYIVDRVTAVAAPEPISTTLFLTGGAAMAANFYRRRKKLVV